jgi:hypothetical protein
MRGGMTRMSLDNRPTKIQIKNIPEETAEADLRQHFEVTILLFFSVIYIDLFINECHSCSNLEP